MKATLICGIAIALASLPTAASPQAPLPLQVLEPVEQTRAFLPANTEILLSMNQEVTSKGDGWNEGDTFNLSVMHDVMHDGYVVIPRGSRGVGRITWMTSKGMFGKSGKMDIELEYVEVNGQRIDVSGTYRQEGEGNTLATVGGVVLVGVFGGFITGRSAVIPRGRELLAHTDADLPLSLPSRARPALQPAYGASGPHFESASAPTEEIRLTIPTMIRARNGSACLFFSTPAGARITKAEMVQIEGRAIERARAGAGAELASMSSSDRSENLRAVAASELGGYDCAH